MGIRENFQGEPFMGIREHFLKCRKCFHDSLLMCLVFTDAMKAAGHLPKAQGKLVRENLVKLVEVHVRCNVSSHLHKPPDTSAA